MRIWKHRELLLELIKREIKARYKQSILGYAWVILVPLINLVVLSIVFSYLIKVPTGGIPYPIFLFTVLVPWNFTSNAIISATGSLSSNASLITKISLPREIFPMSAVLAKGVDLLFSIVILAMFFGYFRVGVNMLALWVIPIFTVHLLLVFGISFFLSAINVFFRDVENILSVVITMWMYLTPVLYPKELIPDKLVPIFNINPMMAIVNSYRNVLLYKTPPPLESFAYASIISILTFLLGYAFFKNRSRYFADVV